MLSHGTDLFVLLSLHHECRERFAGLADALDAETAPQTLALHCLQQARLLLGLDQARVQQLALRAAELLADAGNDSLRYRALQWVCISCASQEDEAWPILAEMQRLERPEWPPRLRRLRLGVEGRVLDLAGRAQEALAVHEASLALARKAGASNVVAGEMTNLAYSYMALGRYEEAVQLGRELLGSPRPAQGRTRLYQLGNTACALLLADDGNAAEARALLSEMLELSSLDGWDSFGVFSDVYAMLAVAEGRLETGARLIGHADRAHEQIGGRFPTSVAARARAWSGLEAAFDVPTLARLCEQGAALDPQTVCAMTLSPPAAQS